MMKDRAKFFFYGSVILVVLFFLIKYSMTVNWDFMSYFLNAKYLFSDGQYFEWYRAPLVPVLIGLFSIFTWKLAGWIFIGFLFGLHGFATYFFSKKFKLDYVLFYLLSLVPCFFIYGIETGTEVLTFSLILLALTYLGFFGIFLGLAFLTRYTNVIFLPLILFLKDKKKILWNVLLFSVIVGVWFLHNWIVTGNPFHSFINSYALNVGSRGYYVMAFDFLHLLVVGVWLWPLFLLGLYHKIKRGFKMIDWSMILIFVLSIYSYYSVPFKTSRYLFILILPLAYFSVYSFRRKKHIKILKIVLGVLVLASMISLLLVPSDNLFRYEDSLTGLDECAVSSNVWVHVNYLGKPSIPFPAENLVEDYINEGYRVILFKGVSEPAYVNSPELLEKYSFIENTTSYVILGNENECKDPAEVKYDLSYLDRLDNEIFAMHGYHIDKSNYYVMFGDGY
jgi:hypothetical protein